MGIRKLIGTKEFYKQALILAIPVFVQNLITNFVSLLDNIMVGQIGTAEMSGVSIANTLIFVFNLCIFGGVSGPGIFSAQFHGNEDHEGVKNCLRYKLYFVIFITFLAILACFFLYEPLINLYLHDSNTENVALTFNSARDYLFVMAFGLVPFAISNAYSGTLRETGQTKVPMRAGIIAVFVNLIFNYFLIFGNFGFPKLGVIGAAVATVLSRYVELLIVVIWTHKNRAENRFVIGLYRSFKIPFSLLKDITVKGLPLMLNESLWSVSVSMLVSLYSTRGLDVVAGLNISTTINNLFNVGFISLGTVIAIIVGNLLGAGKLKEAKEDAGKLIALTVVISTIIGIIAVISAPFFPLIYNTTESVRKVATDVILICAFMSPFHGFVNAAYFTIRSGGKTVITFLLDSAYEWAVTVPLTYILAYFTGIPIVPLYILSQIPLVVKSVVAFILFKKGLWLNNLTEN